ncbi:MAG: hypothetical protein WC730_03215 [Patescibacteria group bacterium]|jgi:hypothetical protein
MANKKVFRGIRTAVGELWHERLVKVSLGVAFACFLLSLGFIFWRLWPEMMAEPSVPLHYNIHFGVDRVGSWWMIFSGPVAQMTIIFLNFCLAVGIWKRDRVLSLFLVGASTIAGIFIFIATLFLVLINVSYYG